MPKKLPPEIREPLKATLISATEKAEVSSNKFLNFNIYYDLAPVDRIIERKSGWNDHAAFVGNRPLSTFFRESIIEGLMSREFRFDEECPLTAIPGYENSVSAADELILRFESLPN